MLSKFLFVTMHWDSTLDDDRMHSRKFMSSYCDTINFTANNSSSKENKFHVIEDLSVVVVVDVFIHKKVSWLRMKISINACAFYWPHFTCKKGIKVSNLKSISRFIDADKGCHERVFCLFFKNYYFLLNLKFDKLQIKSQVSIP